MAKIECTKGLKLKSLESLSNLWTNKDFKELVKILKINQENYAKLCLTRPNWEDVQKLQYQASAISTIISTVEESWKRINSPEDLK